MRRLLFCLVAGSILAFASAGVCPTAGAQTFSLVHRFQNYGPVTYPKGPPVQGRDGKLYAYTYFSGWGSVFREQTGGAGSILYTFTSSDGGATPFSPVLLARDGNWYGTTGNTSSGGVLYRITPGGTYSILHRFSSGLDGDAAIGSPIEVDGKLYGMTVGGRNIGPAVYTYDASGTFTVIYQFATTQFTASAGALVQASDGYLYGAGSGKDGCGAVFRMDTTGSLLNLYNFDCALNVGYLTSPLLEGNDGYLYGTSTGSNLFYLGAVFKVSKAGSPTVLHAFGSVYPDAWYPIGGLALGSDGNIYGTAADDPVNYAGAIYEISGTDDSYQLLHTFVYSYGRWPTGLVQHTDGKFYGYLEFVGSYLAAGEFYSLDMGLGPFVTFVRRAGTVGGTVQILGQDLTGTTSVTFNGVAASSFSVVSDTYMTAVVPSGATTGPVVVTMPGGTLTSNVNFRVTQ